ncbi:hypothetical protein KJ891_05175 [Candidatus Micrarchaeota archaeon]|nr:hypothetical protein [Candidatus Micrarchaeota archaeon]
MELFKIGAGPWKRLFEGDFQGHTMGLYSNPESIVIVVIYEIEAGKPVGAVIDAFKIFSAKGETEAFVDTLPRDVVVLNKHSEKENYKFLLLASKPEYVEWEEGKFISETDRLLKKLKTSASLVKDVSKAYDLELKGLGECDEKTRSAFFSQALFIPVVSASATEYVKGKGTEGAKSAEGADGVRAQESTALAKGEIIIGITKDKNTVVEPLEMFTKTAVFDGTPEERKHVLHILAESAMLSNVPVIVFDFENEFSGLGQPSTNREELKKYKVDAEPIGLPLKHFELFNGIVVDLNMINPEGLTQLFGTGRNVVSKLIADTLKASKVKGITDLKNKIKAIKPGEEPTAYQIRRAARVLKVMGLRYPDLFEGVNDIEGMSKGWMRGLGRGTILHMHTGDLRVWLLVVHSLLRGMQEFQAQHGETKKIKTMLILPEVVKFMPRNAQNVLSQEIVEVLVDISKRYGMGYALSADKSIDISGAIVANSDAKIQLISGNDAGVQLKGQKSYRVFIRPALSTCLAK